MNVLVLLGQSSVLIVMISFIVSNRKPIACLPVTGLEMDMRDNKERKITGTLLGKTVLLSKETPEEFSFLLSDDVPDVNYETVATLQEPQSKVAGLPSQNSEGGQTERWRQLGSLVKSLS